MAQLPETAVTVPPSELNNNANTYSDPLSESKQSETKPTTKEEKQNAKHKDIKIKVLMIRHSSPFYVTISSSATILDLKKEIEKVTASNNTANRHITADKQRLIYKGHALKNKDTIYQCNIKDNHAIHLVPQKAKPKPADDEKKATDSSSQQQQQIIDHKPYKNVVCPKCTMNLCLTQPMLCYASYWSARQETNNQMTVSQIVNACNKAVYGNNNNNNNNDAEDTKSENNTSSIPSDFDESKHGAHCDMDGCPTPNIRSTDYCYHCPNRRCHPFGYDLCQNCARYVDNPFVNLNIATNHVLRYQLNMFADIFYDRYRMLINRAIGGQLTDEEEEKKQEQAQQQRQQQQQQQRQQQQRVVRGQQQRGQQQRGRVVQQRGGQNMAQRQRQQQMDKATIKMNGIDYIQMMDDDKNIILIPKQRIEELERREKPLSINELQQIVCSSTSEFRKRVSAVIANPRLIREIFQKECPNLMRDNLWIRKFVSEAFEHIECRIYIQARMALNLQDIIQIVNDIVNEQNVIRQNNIKANDNKILLRTFKILKASSPQWIADEKIKRCQQCGSSFGYFSRKHHCKACGDIFCGNHCKETTCRPNRNLMPNRTLQNLRIRLCDECQTKYSYYTYTNIPAQR